MKKYSISMKVVLVLFLCSTSYATLWYVHPDSALNAIQAGIDSCSNDDTVLVGPGRYFENITFDGMAITVMSEYGPDTTIIDGDSPSNPDTGSVARFVNGEDTTSVLDGFTITDGSGTRDPLWGFLGGGIFCDNASPTIRGNIITEDTADFGGGIECQYYSSPIIIGNTIRGNRGDSASGGIECYVYSSPHIEDNRIDSNTSNSGGAGIQVYDNCSPSIINNAIIGNIAGSWGGGIRVGIFSSPTITGNFIKGNEAVEGGGIECDGNASPTINSCTITDNTGDGVWCETGSNPVINDNDIFGNLPFGVRNIDAGITINAENNWWGDPSGPSGFGPGTGDSVSNYVDFDPWRTSPSVEEIEIVRPLILHFQVDPNPFQHFTDIRYQITDNNQIVNLKIYDALGRLVRQWDNTTTRLSDNIRWDGTDNLNRRLSCGVYFVNLQAGDYTATEKVLIIR